MLILNTRILITSAYKGGSKYAFWKNLTEGDTVEISTPVKKYHRGGNGLNATEIKFINLNTGEEFNSTMSMSANYLSSIKYEIV